MFCKNLVDNYLLLLYENYLHEIVMPGIPEFKTAAERVPFWSCVCTQKLLVVKTYLSKDEMQNDPLLLDTFWNLLRNVNNKFTKIFGCDLQ